MKFAFLLLISLLLSSPVTHVHAKKTQLTKTAIQHEKLPASRKQTATSTFNTYEDYPDSPLGIKDQNKGLTTLRNIILRSVYWVGLIGPFVVIPYVILSAPG